MTVIMFGVTGVRARACPTGVNRRVDGGPQRVQHGRRDLTGPG